MRSAAAFEDKYRHDADPWNFRSSVYERGRYMQTMASLGRERYEYAFEPGCSIGELTVMLAGRCNRVLATEVSPSAAQRAVIRCADLPGVEIQCSDLKAAMPTGSFDLTVLSEIAYYFDTPEIAAMAERFAAHLVSGGELIAVHWLGHSPDHVLHGDEAHQVLLDTLPMMHVAGQRFAGFRIDRWVKP